MTASAPRSRLEDRLQQRLEDALPRHDVPGAVLGISIGDEAAVAAAGVASVRTGAPVTRDTVFGLGSVTKVYQAALLLSLGLDIDDPVRPHLPEFRVADAAATDEITIRQLLTHSSGLEDNHMPDFGWGDDAVRLYVESCAGLGQLHPPGRLTSYCNSGVIVGGRTVEVVVGSCWDKALRDRLLAPAGLESTVSLPWEAILHPVAVGHMRGPDGPVVSPKWAWPRTWAPAGGTLAASAPDVLAFARLHLKGAAPLGSEITQSMAELQRSWPAGLRPGLVGMGLGWFLFDWDGTLVPGHDGAPMGGLASLRIVPDYDAAVVFLSNHEDGGLTLAEELLPGVLADELGLSIGQAQPTANPHPESGYIGAYKRLDAEFGIAARPEGRLTVTKRQQALDVAVPESVAEFELEPIGPNLFRGRPPQYPTEIHYRFVDTDGDEVCDYLYESVRASRRS